MFDKNLFGERRQVIDAPTEESWELVTKKLLKLGFREDCDSYSGTYRFVCMNASGHSLTQTNNANGNSIVKAEDFLRDNNSTLADMLSILWR